MKKTVILLVSITLSLALLLSSCGRLIFGEERIFPDGYTGGFGIGYGSKIEYYWVETYEEAMAAIELLKSHGSTFEESAIFSYEGELFDTKYCFQINGHKADYVKFGDNPYDRRAEGVRVSSWGFFEDVTIDEIVYGYINNYDACSFIATDYLLENYSEINFTIDKLTYQQQDSSGAYYVYYNDKWIFGIGTSEKISEDCVRVILDSVKFVGFDR